MTTIRNNLKTTVPVKILKKGSGLMVLFTFFSRHFNPTLLLMFDVRQNVFSHRRMESRWLAFLTAVSVWVYQERTLEVRSPWYQSFLPSSLHPVDIDFKNWNTKCVAHGSKNSLAQLQFAYTTHLSNMHFYLRQSVVSFIALLSTPSWPTNWSADSGLWV